MEPARIRITLESEVGGSISLLGTEHDLAAAVERLRVQGWRVVERAAPADLGRFPISPDPFVATPQRAFA